MQPARIQELEARREQLRSQLLSLREMRRGSLVERYRRCGKSNCHCARQGAPGHGPSFSLTHAEGGKTVTRVIPATAVQETRQQLSEYRRFRQLARDFLEVNERLCEVRLKHPTEKVEKGGSRRRSPRRSSGKSRLS